MVPPSSTKKSYLSRVTLIFSVNFWNFGKENFLENIMNGDFLEIFLDFLEFFKDKVCVECGGAINFPKTLKKLVKVATDPFKLSFT